MKLGVNPCGASSRTRLAAALALTLLSAASAFSATKGHDAAPEVVRSSDPAKQSFLYQDARATAACDSSWVVAGEVCWRIRPVAWQAYNEQKKGISLAIDIWGGPQADLVLSRAKLTVSIDGIARTLTDLAWKPSSAAPGGYTTVIQDEGLIRKIAAARVVQMTARGNVRVDNRLSSGASRSLNAVLDQYDALSHRQAPGVSVASSGDGSSEQGNLAAGTR